MQDKEVKKNTKSLGQRLIYKLFVYTASLAVVAGVIGVIFLIQEKKVAEEAERIEAEENATKEAAKAAMTEDEIQALYKVHKKDGTAIVEAANDVEASMNEENPDTQEDVLNEEYEAAIVSESPIDWEGLWEVNEDVYAWITVPGTVIDYPILQHATDNTYYLYYNIDGSYGYPGCIYTENMNAKDFTDNNTVIYGHNMKNGSMFAGLHQFEDKAFFDGHQKVLIYMPEKSYEYTIFAAYVYDDRHLLYSFDFSNEDVYASYLENIQGMRDLNANLRSDVTVTKENKIITLATCMANQPEKRLLVQAVLDE